MSGNLVNMDLNTMEAADEDPNLILDSILNSFIDFIDVNSCIHDRVFWKSLSKIAESDTFYKTLEKIDKFTKLLFGKLI